MKTKYAFQGLKENMARAISKDLGISTKVSIEIANFIRGKSTSEAKKVLERVLEKKQAIPYKRFTDGVGHRKGANIAAGRFPQKATEAFITIIKQCEANAQAKGLSSDLRIVHLVAQKGTNMFRHGRQRRRMYKRTHLEIVLEEIEPVKSDKKVAKKESKAPSKKVESEIKESKEKKEVVKESKKDDSKAVKKEPKIEPKKEEAKSEVKEKDDSKAVKKEPAKKAVEDDDSKTVKKEQAVPSKTVDSKKENTEDKK